MRGKYDTDGFVVTDAWWLRYRVRDVVGPPDANGNPTGGGVEIKAKVWGELEPEPAAWDYEITDETAYVNAAGWFGFTTITNYKMRVRRVAWAFGDNSAVDLWTPPAPPVAPSPSPPAPPSTPPAPPPSAPPAPPFGFVVTTSVEVAGALAASVDETALAGAVSAAVVDALPAEERDEASVTVGMRVQTNIAMNTAAYDQNDVALTAELQRSGCVDHLNGGVLGPSECAVTITCLGCTRPEGGMKLDLQITRTSAEGAPVAVNPFYVEGDTASFIRAKYGTTHGVDAELAGHTVASVTATVAVTRIGVPGGVGHRRRPHRRRDIDPHRRRPRSTSQPTTSPSPPLSPRSRRRRRRRRRPRHRRRR